MSTLSSPSTPSTDVLLNLGILIESIAGYPDLPMTSAISLLLSDNNNTVPAHVSDVLLSRGIKDPNATVHELHDFLSGLPKGESLAHRNIVAFLVMTSLCFVAVAVRMYVRRFITRRVRAEEWWCLGGFFGTICACIVFIWCHTSSFGAGQHVWNISYNSLKRFAMILYPVETVFNTAFWPIKISFLAFYHSLSPQLLYNRAVLLVGVFITCWILMGDMLVFFQCRPLEYWHDVVGAKCFDRDRIFTAWGAINLLTDFAILLLPVPVVLQLQLKRREKAAVLSIFATGAFICIVGINRLITMRTWLQHTDAPYLFAKTAVWSLMEIDLALIISCVPALKVLLTRPSLSPVSAISRMTTSARKPSVAIIPGFWSRKGSVSNGTSNGDSEAGVGGGGGGNSGGGMGLQAADLIRDGILSGPVNSEEVEHPALVLARKQRPRRDSVDAAALGLVSGASLGITMPAGGGGISGTGGGGSRKEFDV